MDKLVKFIQANPMRANLIGLGVGAVIGALIGAVIISNNEEPNLQALDGFVEDALHQKLDNPE